MSTKQPTVSTSAPPRDVIAEAERKLKFMTSIRWETAQIPLEDLTELLRLARIGARKEAGKRGNA